MVPRPAPCRTRIAVCRSSRSIEVSPVMQSSKGAMTFTVMRDSLPMRRRFVIQGLRRGGLAAVGLMGLLVGPGVVRAEGGCPAGHYPIGGQGVQGCAPIPAASAPVSRPNGKWIKTWGALVYSNSTGDTGVATGKTSKSAAVDEALANCRGGGSPDCVSQVTYKNQCVAVARPTTMGSEGAYFTGATEEIVRRGALARCTRGGAICEGKYVDCTLPIFEKF